MTRCWCLVCCLCWGTLVRAEQWTLPLIGVGETALEHVGSVTADRARKKLYVGILSRDAARTGLRVYDLDEAGQPIGKPRKYSDHPDELPLGHHSTPVCMLLDEQHRRLYLGVHGSHPTHARALVTYSLNDAGEPQGKPEAFDHGNVNKACDALLIHPRTGKLLAVGWGGEGLFVVDRDTAGRPTGKPLLHRFSGYGSRSFGLRSDGTKLYRGTYPSVIEVCDLDPEGNVVGKARNREIPNGAKDYAVLTVTDRALYFKGPEQRLCWFRLNEQGEITGDMQSAEWPHLQAVALSERPNHLLVALATHFKDSVTGQPVVDGVEVREVALQADGSPGAVVRQTAPFARSEAIALSGGSHAALAAKSLGRGFLGNRLSGLQVRCSIVALEADGVPVPAMRPVKFSDQAGYLKFTASKRHRKAYAVGKGEIVAVDVSSAIGKLMPTRSIKLSAEATGELVVDEPRDRLFVALKSGEIAVTSLDQAGWPTGAPELLKTSLASIGALVVHAPSGKVLAVGAPGGTAANEPRVVSIAAGVWIADAVVDTDRGRLYVAEQYRGHDNLSVWKLTADGALSSTEPVRFADGIPVETPTVRGLLYGLKLDAARRKLYAGGAQENPTTQPGHLIVWDLDSAGDPVANSRRLLPSANTRGSCQCVEISGDRRHLYESGWGDNRVFVRQLDEHGEPSRDSVPWLIGGYGKRQLNAMDDKLLAGTHPSELEVISLRTAADPLPAAHVELAGESLQTKLGLLAVGQTSDWVPLDAALKNGIGPSVLRCTLSGAPVKHATLRWEVARADGDRLETIRTADVELIGHVGALILPKYGTDRIAVELKSMIKTSAEEFGRYREIAQQYAMSASERPQMLSVANGLIGLDSSGEALEAGMETLAVLGHNTAQIWNWPGVAPEKIREVAARHGIRRFREAIYNPPSYFHFNVDQVRPEALDQWADGFRAAAQRMGAKPEEIELMHIGDEPGWYFPRMLDEVQQDPRRLAVFRDYLKSKGLTPADVGATQWEQVLPGRLSAAQTLPQKRLHFWTTRFFAESLSISFAEATKALRRKLNPKLLTTCNLNNWPGRFFIASPGAKIANNSDAGPDASMGMPDWFDLGRKQAVTCIWTEDWFGDREAQLWSLYGDLLRCAAREGGVEYGGYPVGQSTGAFPEGATLKIASLVGHGAKSIDPYIFGSHLAFADGWSEKEVTYRNLGAALRVIGKAERLLAPGRPRDGSVAIVFPQASQVWDAGSPINCYQEELYGLHAALTHENFPVDFMDDFGLEAGDLRRRSYAAIFVTAPNLSVKAQQALLDWTEAGGTLVLAPGACAADEYNEPTQLLRSKLGATQAAVARVHPPHFSLAHRLERTAIDWPRDGAVTEPLFATIQAAPLVVNSARAIATFADKSAAATEITVGKGRLIGWGCWPGVTYWLSPDRSEHSRLPQEWSASVRSFVTSVAHQAKASRPVIVSEPGVEACWLESDAGVAITLLNWTGRPISKLRVTMPGLKSFANMTTVEHGPQTPVTTTTGLEFAFPLHAVDVLLLEKK